jgi:hypothetical protein
MDPEDIIKSMFAERLSNPLEWFRHSRALIASARILKERTKLLVNLIE